MERDIKQELCKELVILSHKIDRLEAFLEKHKGVSEYHINLLKQQLVYMKGYYDTLLARVVDLG